MKRTWNLSPVLLIFQKCYCPCLHLIIGHVWWLNELWFKRYIQKCTLSQILMLIMTSHYLVNHGMCKNTKTWKSWERNITFLRNKKIYNLSFRWHILRSYGFEADVTVNVKIYYYLELSNYYSFLLLNVNCYNSKFVITN